MEDNTDPKAGTSTQAIATNFKTYLPVSISKIPPTLVEVASRNQPFLIPKPQLRDREFDYDIPGGCVVRLVLKNGNIYEGTQFINPKLDISSKTKLKLIKVYKVSPTDFEPLTPPISGILEFDTGELHKVYILEYIKPQIRSKSEIIMETFVVKTQAQFKNLIAALTSGSVSEVGFKLFGYNKGRFMDLFWIVLCVRETLIPIDMKGELSCSEVWFELKEKLFENGSILKIVHDVRYETDYLYHSVIDGIRLKNVYDTQFAIYFMDSRARYMEKKRFKKKNHGKEPQKYSELLLNKLSLALTRYLGNVISEREIIMIYKYESEDWTQVTHYTQRPLPNPQVLKYMALSVKYLSLLKTELVGDMMLCYDVCCQKLMHHMHGVSHVKAAKIVEEPSRLPEELQKEVESYAVAMNLEKDRTVDSDIITIINGPNAAAEN